MQNDEAADNLKSELATPHPVAVLVVEEGVLSSKDDDENKLYMKHLSKVITLNSQPDKRSFRSIIDNLANKKKHAD